MKKRVYISGGITGLDYNDTKTRFARAEQAITELGLTAVNPFNNGLPRHSPWAEHMIADLQLLRDCDAILLLHGWRESNGATIECIFAEMAGMRIFYDFKDLEDWVNDEQ